MNRHASMNRIYRLVWSQVSSAWIPVAETAKGRGKSGRARSIASRNVLSAAISVALGSVAHASPPVPACVAPTCGTSLVSATSHPLGAQVVSGTASITQSGNTTDVRQSSPDVSIDWLSFNVGSQATIDFIQPSASAVAVNRISGTSGSEILGHLDANGQVYLINPNGIVFGQGAQVNVGGLVASTLDASGSTSGANPQSFAGNGTGSIVNQGTITAVPGGYVALIGNHVSNQGVITAQLGTAALGAGSAVTLTFNGDSLVHVEVDRSVLQSLAANGGLIQANGGQVIMTAGARDALLASVVNNTGVIEARTVENHEGTITLLGGMEAGTVAVGGTLDASAPDGGHGGFIETSAAHVEVANDARITTAAAGGLTGSWLIDPQDFTVAPSGGDITGATLSSELGGTSVTLESSQGANAGSGNVNVNDTVSWSANTSLTLTASNNVNVNGSITATGASAALVINPNTANGGTETPSGTGTLNLGAGASITLSGASAALSISTPTYSLGAGATINLPNESPTSTTALVIGGTPYTVINSLGAQGSTTGTDLQGISGALSGDYALGSNVVATATSGWSGGFAPLGNAGTPFSGIFDGLGHTIGNLSINLPSTPNVGLFGYTAPGAVIQNVGLTGGSVTGGNGTGMLVGFNQGTVNNAYSTGSVSGANGRNGGNGANGYDICNIFYCYGNANGGNGTSGGAGGALGGLVGINSGAINNSSSSATVNGGNGGTGGSGGNADSFYTYPGSSSGVNYGNGGSGGGAGAGGSIGGLVGSNSGSIAGSFATGSVSGANGGNGGNGGNYGRGIAVGTGSNGNAANGSAGGSIGGLAGVSTGTISGTFASGAVSGGNGGLGGAGGYLYGDGLFPRGSNGASAAGGASGGLVGYNAGPIASSYASGTVSGANGGSAANDQVTTVATGGAGGAVGGLVGDNDGASISDSYATGAVTGANGGTAGSAGFFIGASGSTGGAGGQVGGLIGMDVSGTVSHSYATGAVTGANGGGGAVAGGWYYQAGPGTVDFGGNGVAGNGGLGGAAGGLIGSENSGLIVGSYATGSVSGANGGSGGADGALHRDEGGVIQSGAGIIGNGGNGGNVGGFAGYSSSAISSSYATGAVNGGAGGNGGNGDDIALPGAGGNGGSVGGFVGTLAGSISTTYSTGSVSGATAGQASQGAAYAGQNGAAGSLGGFAGGGAGSATGSYWDITTSGLATSAAGVGLTQALMQSQASFAGWDFNATWVIYPGYTYPLLQSYMTPLTVTANNAVITYNGQPYSGGNGVTYSSTPNANLLGPLTYGGSSQGAVNVGGYTIMPILYSGQLGYIITVVGSTLTVNPLALTGASISGVTATYGSAVVPGILTFTNVVPGDQVTAAVSLLNALYSASGHLDAGSYFQSASAALSGSSAGNYTFSGFTTATANYLVNPLTLTGASISPVTTTYGTSAATGAVSFANLIAGDQVASVASLVNPAFSVSGNLAAGSYAQTASPLTGADAINYTFSGYTTAASSYLVNPLTISVTGLLAANKVYNGSSAAALTGSASIDTISGDAATLSGAGTASFADANVGNNKAVTVSGYSLTGADSGDYVLVEPTGLTANITQLPSVTWVGGATGSWSNAANWGGAIPDYANVAAVIIPAGKTVTYDSGVPGTTTLTSLTDSGTLVMAAGDLTVNGNLSTAGFKQSGGTLDVGGTLSINSNAATVTLGNIDAGSLDITDQTGTITQAASTALNVTGATALTGDTITLASSTNNFEGALSSSGFNVKVDDDGAGGLILGNTTVSGSLTLASRAGAITEAAAAAIDATGPVSLTANNGLTGSSAVSYNISLANSANTITSPVSATGSNISLADSGTSGLTLGNVTAGGTLTVTSLDGTISQAAATKISATGASSLTADGGNIDLSGASNKFVGAVTASGTNITLDDSVALTADLDAVDAASLTTAKALDVSGAIGAGLTTDALDGKTKFGATTVGTTLDVTSTGSVTSTTAGILIVDGEKTTKPNANVTVNGTVGALIK